MYNSTNETRCEICGQIDVNCDGHDQTPATEPAYTREDRHMSTAFGPLAPAGFQRTCITVYHRSTDIDGNLGAAKINWSAIGSVSVEEARAFHAALGQAIEEAEALNAQGGN